MDKILSQIIVDDCNLNRFITKMFLEKINDNIKIIEKSNGKDLIEYIEKNNNCPLIWMDIEMPKMDGIKCTDILRNKLNYKGTIIGVTSHADLKTINECKKIGMDDVITKPFTQKDLVDKINNLIH